MRHNAYAALFGLLVICASSFAELGDYGTDYPEYDTGSTGAWEIDYNRCDRGGIDTTEYCAGYCEYQTGEGCFYSSHIASETPQMIDQCVCTCGVDQETVTFNNVPCMDITQYAEPIGYTSSDEYGGSGCCLPMFFLIGVAGFALMRR